MPPPDGVPFFVGVSCDATLVWPGGASYDLHMVNFSTINLNGWLGLYRTDVCPVDCYDAGSTTILFGAPPGTNDRSPADVYKLPGAHGLDVWGKYSDRGGLGSLTPGAQGGGTLVVSCPVVSLTADGGTVFSFSCDPGEPVVGPAGNPWIDFAGMTRDKRGNPINLLYLYTCSALPAGLSITHVNDNTPSNFPARLSGTLSVPGTYTFSLRPTACDLTGISSGCSGVVTVSVSVGCPAIAILPSAL